MSPVTSPPGRLVPDKSVTGCGVVQDRESDLTASQVEKSFGMNPVVCGVTRGKLVFSLPSWILLANASPASLHMASSQVDGGAPLTVHVS